MKDFLEQCRKSVLCYLSPNKEVLTKPGGALKFALAGHKGAVMSITLKKDGVTAASRNDSFLMYLISKGYVIDGTVFKAVKIISLKSKKLCRLRDLKYQLKPRTF